eukprot:2156911-Rhodomonas_salina.3
MRPAVPAWATLDSERRVTSSRDTRGAALKLKYKKPRSSHSDQRASCSENTRVLSLSSLIQYMRVPGAKDATGSFISVD